jgi:hypothetical protein
MGRWLNGLDGQTGRHKDDMDGWTDGLTDRCMHSCMNKQMEGRRD